MQLIGHINPTGVESGFMIPVFKQPPANGLFVQKRSKRSEPLELVVFDIDNVEGFHRMEEPIIIAPHENEEYFSFKHDDEFIHGYHESFDSDLSKIYPEFEKYPVLRFSVSRFLGLDADLPATFAIAYSHIGITSSEEAANNWQDTQVFLPQILEALDKTPDNSRNSIERVEVKSKGSKVEVTLVTTNEFDFEYKPQLILTKSLTHLDPELDVSVKTVPISKTWERIAENAEQINEDEMENEIDTKLRELSQTYDANDPVKRKQEADAFRLELLGSLLEAGEKLRRVFGVNKVIIQNGSVNPKPAVDGMRTYGRVSNIAVKALTGKVTFRIFVYPITIDKTLIGYGNENLDVHLSNAVNKIEIDNSNSEALIEIIRDEIYNYIGKMFIRTFSSRIDELK